MLNERFYRSWWNRGWRRGQLRISALCYHHDNFQICKILPQRYTNSFFCPLCFCFSLQRAVVGLNVPLRVHWNCQRHLRQAVHKLLSAQQKASESVCTVQSAWPFDPHTPEVSVLPLTNKNILHCRTYTHNYKGWCSDLLKPNHNNFGFIELIFSAILLKWQGSSGTNQIKTLLP